VNRPAAPHRTVDSEHLLRLARYLLPVVVVLVCLGAWYSDVIADLFAHRTRMSDVAGSWVLDEEALARNAEGVASIVPPGRERDAMAASLVAKGDAYRGVVLTFEADRLVTRSAAGAREQQGVYEGFSEASLAFTPAGQRSIAIIIDDPGKRIRLAQPVLSIPLKRAPE
jgi:hypothetical protein